MTPEARFAAKVDAFLFKHQALVYNIDMLAQCGIPDRMGCVRGMFFAMEIKHSRKEVDNPPKNCRGTVALQRYNIGKILNNGGFATFVYPENFDLVKQKFIQYIGDA